MLEIDVALWFVLPPVFSAILLAALHWFPWHSGARELGRPAAYMIGTTVVVGVPVATMLLSVAIGGAFGTLFWAALLVCNAAASGGMVVVAHWIDSHRALTLEDAASAARRD